MPDDYGDAAQSARDAGMIHAADIQPQQVQASIARYLNIEDPQAPGAQRLLREATDAAMDQTVQDAQGRFFASRKNLQVWEDTHGNIMGQAGGDVENRRKLIDSDDRTDL
jgi:hypothetical protein